GARGPREARRTVRWSGIVQDDRPPSQVRQCEAAPDRGCADYRRTVIGVDLKPRRRQPNDMLVVISHSGLIRPAGTVMRRQMAVNRGVRMVIVALVHMFRRKTRRLRPRWPSRAERQLFESPGTLASLLSGPFCWSNVPPRVL